MRIYTRKYELDECAFDSDSAECRYWAGFMLADGCIGATRQGCPVVILSLAARDVDHVRDFGQFLGSTHPIKVSNCVRNNGLIGGRPVVSTGLARLAISSRKLAAKLGEYGVVPRKSTKEILPNHLVLDPDIWRGLIDGDGWVFVDKLGHPHAGVCGSIDLCNQFSSLVNNLTGKICKPTKHGAIWSVSLSNTNARAVISFLYGRKGPMLRRKGILAHAIIAADWTRLHKNQTPHITKPIFLEAMRKADGNLYMTSDLLGLPRKTSAYKIAMRIGLVGSPLRIGKDSYRNCKLTQSQSEEIRRIYAEGTRSQQDLANIYTVSVATINRVLRHNLWKTDSSPTPSSLPRFRMLPLGKAIEIIGKVLAGESQTSIAKQYGIDRGLVSRMSRGEYYRDAWEVAAKRSEA